MSTRLESAPEGMTTADSFRGKRVIDREGVEYGKIRHIHINPETLVVSGVTIRKGLGKEYYLTSDYIDKFSEKTLHLSRPPIRMGATVIDGDRNKLGKVKRLHRNPDTEELESIEISDGLTNTKIVSKSDIWGIGDKVILRMSKKEFKQMQ